MAGAGPAGSGLAARYNNEVQVTELGTKITLNRAIGLGASADVVVR